MNWFKRLLANERALKAERAYRRGYDWAAGLLLRGYPADSVMDQLDGEQPYEFDRGVTDACNTYKALRQQADDMTYIQSKVPALTQQLFALRRRK